MEAKEILQCGKQVDADRWVYGYLIFSTTESGDLKPVIIPVTNHLAAKVTANGNYVAVFVEPDSVTPYIRNVKLPAGKSKAAKPIPEPVSQATADKNDRKFGCASCYSEQYEAMWKHKGYNCCPKCGRMFEKR